MKLHVKLSTLTSIGFVLAMLSCNKSKTTEESEYIPIDTGKYALNYYDSADTKVDSARVTTLVENSIIGAFNKSNKMSDAVQKDYSAFFSLKDISVSGVKPVSVKTEGLINDIFNSTGTQCLTGRADKIRNYAKDKVPEGLALNSADAEMLHYQDLPGIVILSTFKITRTNGKVEHYTLPSGRIGVSSILELINPNDANSFIYQMDCSGYLTFALTFAAGKAKVAELQAAGNSSTNAKKSSIVAYGMFTSPLAIALRGDVFNLAFDDATRKQVLKNIQANPSSPILDKDVITVNNYFYLLITSSSGSSNFSGKFDASAGVHILKADFSSTAGAAVSRSVSFTRYETYVSTRLDDQIENETSMTGAELKAAIASIK